MLALIHIRRPLSWFVTVLMTCLVVAAAPTSAAPSSVAQQGAPPAVQAEPERATTPKKCAESDYLWKHLTRCGHAGRGNTGPAASQCPNGLRSLGSSPTRQIRVTRDGASFSCRKITGCLSIEASNVLVENVRISCSSGTTGEDANGTGVIKVRGGASARVIRVAINGRSAVHSCVWHEGKRVLVRRVNCRGVNDGIFAWSDPGGDNVTVAGSYFHDFTEKTANGHIDGFQTQGSRHGRILRNTYLMTTDANDRSTSAIAIWNSMRDSRDFTVAGNLIAGGGFSVYAEDYHPSEDSPEGGNVVKDVTFTDNLFSRRLFGCIGYYGVWFRVGPTDRWRRSGNVVLETGRSVDRGNPRFRGDPCE